MEAGHGIACDPGWRAGEYLPECHATNHLRGAVCSGMWGSILQNRRVGMLRNLHRISSPVIEPSKKGKGFEQPTAVHEHWHIDISYLWEFGHRAYPVTVLEGKSRYVLSHSAPTNIEVGSIEKALQKATERFRDARPTLITHNSSQFVSSQFRGLLVD